MVELYDARTMLSYGTCSNCKVASEHLLTLMKMGQLSQHSDVGVLITAKDGATTTSRAIFKGARWRIKGAKQCAETCTAPSLPSMRPHHKRQWMKTYSCSEECFREAFPDWMNRPYTLSADSMQKIRQDKLWRHLSQRKRRKNEKK